MQPANGSGVGQQPQQQHELQQQQWMAMQQYQQQWMAMQYPATAMVMQHQMMYGQQQYVPYHYQYQQQQQQQQPQQQQRWRQPQIQTSADDNKTIWIGDLQQWMDEAYLQSCFTNIAEVMSAKVIRNKQTGQSERYGFLEFTSHEAAEKVLQSYNGTAMPNAEQVFRLNWAAFSMGDRRPEAGSDLSIFVGDLAADVTDSILQETFASRYSSVKGAKVVVDSNTGRPKGYGFVRFGDENEKSRAMNEMNGMYCSGRPMRIGVATPKKPAAQQLFPSQALVLTGGYPSNGITNQGIQSDGNSSNTTIFVGGLDSDVTDEVLRQSFSQCGEVVAVKIPVGKGCGFVQFSNRSNAEDAMQKLNGAVLGKQTVRLSWGRNPGNRQRMEASNWSDGAYYGKQGYSSYGYATQNEDPSMYTTGRAYSASTNGHGVHHMPVN